MRVLYYHREKILKLFQKRRKTLFGKSEEIRDIAIERVSSIRQTRSIFRYTLTWSGGRRTIVYGHTHSKQTYVFLSTIWRERFQNDKTLCTPRPLVYIPSYDLFLYESFAGDRLRDLLEKKPLPVPRLKTLLAQTAAWLATLHAIPISHSQRFRKASPFSQSKIISTLLPTLPARDRRTFRKNVAKLFEIILPSLPREKTLIHRDPHIANIILQPKTRRLALIDYSESGIGQPMIDVATMIVHLRVALHPFYSPKNIEAMSEHFLTSYRRRARLPRGEFRLHLTAFLAIVSLHFWAFTVVRNPRLNRSLRWMIREFQNMWSESFHLLQ